MFKNTLCVCTVALNADAEHAPRPEPSTCNRQLAGSAQTWSVRHRICHAGRPPHPALPSIRHHAHPYHCRCPSSAATSCRCPPASSEITPSTASSSISFFAVLLQCAVLLHLFPRRPSSMRRCSARLPAMCVAHPRMYIIARPGKPPGPSHTLRTLCSNSSAWALPGLAACQN